MRKMLTKSNPPLVLEVRIMVPTQFIFIIEAIEIDITFWGQRSNIVNDPNIQQKFPFTKNREMYMPFLRLQIVAGPQ